MKLDIFYTDLNNKIQINQKLGNNVLAILQSQATTNDMKSKNQSLNSKLNKLKQKYIQNYIK